MRETRVQTEDFLKVGQVAEAESYMRARRDELQQHGVQIRKLNQAYFALYGSYGEGFAASPSNPIPRLLRTLREFWRRYVELQGAREGVLGLVLSVLLAYYAGKAVWLARRS